MQKDLSDWIKSCCFNFFFQAMIWFAKSEQLVFKDFDINETNYIHDISNFLNEVIIFNCYYFCKKILTLTII